MWWFFQILACLIIVAVSSSYRHYGFTLQVWLLSLVFILPAQALLCKSYDLAPSFFSAAFLGNVVLAVTMFLASFLFFDGVIALRHYIGIALAITAGYLLIT